MPDKNILELPAAQQLLGNDSLHISQGGVDKRVSADKILEGLSGDTAFNVVPTDIFDTSKTITIGDRNGYFRSNSDSTVTVTISPSSDAAWVIGDTFTFIKVGAGDVAFVGGAGVTVNPSTSGTIITENYQVLQAMYVGNNTWDLITGGAGVSTIPIPVADYTELLALNPLILEDGQQVTITNSGIAGTGFIRKVVGHGFTSIKGVIVRLDNNTYWERDYTSLNIKWWGAVGDGVTDDTVAFGDAVSFLAPLGGGEIQLPYGPFVLNNFDLEDENIVFVGQSSGGTYGNGNLSTKIIPAAGATYAVYFKDNSCTGSGFKNLQIKGTCEYGVFIYSGDTIMEDVVIEGFEYGCVIADGGNNNQFTNCTFTGCTKVGFAVTNHNNWANHHPNIPVPGAPLSTTSFFLDNCLFRTNEWGAVIRTGTFAQFNNCTFESNTQAGTYIHRDDNTTVRNILFWNCWWENNYDLTSPPPSYSITGNNAFALGAGQISWSNVADVLYEVVIDSQTSGGGGGNNVQFINCTSSSPEATKKGWLIKSGIGTRLEQCYISGGDFSNYIKINAGAIGTILCDIVQNNDPTEGTFAIIDAVVDNSTTTSIYKTGHDDRLVMDVQLGAIKSNVVLDGTNPSTDPNSLDYYEEGTWTPVVSGTWSVNPTSISGRYTRVGNLVTVQAIFDGGAKATAVAGWLSGLPFPVLFSGTGAVVDSSVVEYGSAMVDNTDRLWLTNTTFGSGGNRVTVTYYT